VFEIKASIFSKKVSICLKVQSNCLIDLQFLINWERERKREREKERNKEREKERKKERKT